MNDKINNVLLKEQIELEKSSAPEVNRRPRRCGYTIKFQQKYSLPSYRDEFLCRYFHIKPRDLEIVSEKSLTDYQLKCLDKQGIIRTPYRMSKIFKFILQVISVRKGGLAPKTITANRNLILSSANYSNHIPKENM